VGQRRRRRRRKTRRSATRHHTGERGNDRGRRRWGLVDGFRSQAVVIDRKILVPVRIDKGKCCPTGAVHRSFAGLPATPSQVDTSNAGGKNEGLFGRDAGVPAQIGGVKHSVSFCVPHEGLHCRIRSLGAVLFHRERLTGLWFLGNLSPAVVLSSRCSAASLFSTHSCGNLFLDLRRHKSGDLNRQQLVLARIRFPVLLNDYCKHSPTAGHRSDGSRFLKRTYSAAALVFASAAALTSRRTHNASPACLQSFRRH